MINYLKFSFFWICRVNEYYEKVVSFLHTHFVLYEDIALEINGES